MKGPYITHAEELLFEHFEYTSKEFQDCLRGVTSSSTSTTNGVGGNGVGSNGGYGVGGGSQGAHANGAGASRRVSRDEYESQEMLINASRAMLKTPPTGDNRPSFAAT